MTAPRNNSPDAVEDRLISLGTILSSASLNGLVHPAQATIPEWRGADVRITSDFIWEPSEVTADHDLIVRSLHAKALTWLFFELRDAFCDYLDHTNKYGFYEALAQAALNYLAEHQPEDEDPRYILGVVLASAFQWLESLRERGKLPEQAGIILHQRDEEGRQSRR